MGDKLQLAQNPVPEHINNNSRTMKYSLILIATALLCAVVVSQGEAIPEEEDILAQTVASSPDWDAVPEETKSEGSSESSPDIVQDTYLPETDAKSKAGWHRWRPHAHHPFERHAKNAERHVKRHVKRVERHAKNIARRHGEEELLGTDAKSKAGWHRWRPHAHNPLERHAKNAERHVKRHTKHTERAVKHVERHAKNIARRHGEEELLGTDAKSKAKSKGWHRWRPHNAFERHTKNAQRHAKNAERAVKHVDRH